MKPNRVQKKSSKTAAYTCCMRAASYLDKNPNYHSNDFIAPKLLPKFAKLFINTIKNILAPKGIYEYVISRTKFVDEIFEKAINENFEQILLFGAGFDSRGIRFVNEKQNIKVFELDAKYTQEAKIKQLKKRNMQSPANLVYIPIDFNIETIEKKLDEYGFLKHKKCLFILEGLTMYLKESAVEKTFKIIYDYGGNGSLVFFDYVYASVLRNENLYYGEKNIHKVVLNASEPWQFGIEKGNIENFLTKKGFKFIEQLNSEEMENRYFKNNNGKIIGRVNGTHCLVLAEKC